LYVAVMVCGPREVKVVVRVAVPLAPAVAVAPADSTLGLPIGVVPLKNVTVPLGPAVLLLAEEIVAVNVIGVPDATVDVLGTMAVAVGALDTVTLSGTAALGGL
jgi:hypothetical protein